MWSGGRSLRSIAVVGGLAGSLCTAAGQTPLCNGQHPGNPELISGAASCFFNGANGVGETLIRLDQASVIRWDHLGLGNPDSSLRFEWNGGAIQNAAVLNRIEGVKVGRVVPPEEIAGTLSFQDGSLIVTHPDSALSISGRVSARSITMATHQLDSDHEARLLLGEGGDFLDATHPLIIKDGHVVALDGDAILAGAHVLNSSGMNSPDDATGIVAPGGSVRIFGGRNFRLLAGGDERIQRLPGGQGGFINNSRSVRAGRDIEMVAEGGPEAGIDNNGLIEADFLRGRVFLRIDQGGRVTNNAVISASSIESNAPIGGEGTRLEPNEGDTPSPLSTGLSRIPIVARPGEQKSSRKVVLVESAPVTGSASVQRQRANRSRGGSGSRRTQLAGGTTNREAHLARGRSFFGVRGGTTARKR